MGRILAQGLAGDRGPFARQISDPKILERRVMIFPNVVIAVVDGLIEVGQYRGDERIQFSFCISRIRWDLVGMQDQGMTSEFYRIRGGEPIQPSRDFFWRRPSKPDLIACGVGTSQL